MDSYLLIIVLIILACRLFAPAPRRRPTARTAYARQFSRQRLAALARDRHHCQYPGCTASGAGMHVHHRQYRSRGGSNDLGNLITLCPYHHRRVHRR